MTAEEFSNQFDILYNSITSNQAPGLNEYEKSVFLTKAQNELVLNYFNPKSKGNTVQEGFDSTPKRQMDFSRLLRSTILEPSSRVPKTDPRATVYMFFQKVSEDLGEEDAKGNKVYHENVINNAKDVFIIVNEQIEEFNISSSQYYVYSADSAPGQWSSVELTNAIKRHGFFIGNYPSLESIDCTVFPGDYVRIINITSQDILQVIPINLQEYARLMSKPFKEPLKRQAWRLLNTRDDSFEAEIVMPSSAKAKYSNFNYHVTYIKKPVPIILCNLAESFGGLSIDGYVAGGVSPDGLREGNGFTGVDGSELDPVMHDAILQRAVELAKISWGGDINQTNLVTQAGLRSE